MVAGEQGRAGSGDNNDAAMEAEDSRPSFIARGPVREEYAAPWRLEFTVEVLQAEMAKRSSMWRVGGIDEDRREEIKRVMVEATRMWIQSLHDTVWANIVWSPCRLGATVPE